jgi:hypothetical protein
MAMGHTPAVDRGDGRGHTVGVLEVLDHLGARLHSRLPGALLVLDRVHARAREGIGVTRRRPALLGLVVVLGLHGVLAQKLAVLGVLLPDGVREGGGQRVMALRREFTVPEVERGAGLRGGLLHSLALVVGALAAR